jgi:CRP-like cAMP-binding protein
MTAVERAIALRNVEAFRRVPMEQLAYLAAAAREEWYPAGSYIFREGEPPGGLVVILEGKIHLERKSLIFGEAGAGEPLGTWSLFDDRPRRAGAKVAGDARVLILDRDDFYEVLSEHVEIARSLVTDLVRKLLDLTGLGDEETG